MIDSFSLKDIFFHTHHNKYVEAFKVWYSSCLNMDQSIIALLLCWLLAWIFGVQVELTALRPPTKDFLLMLLRHEATGGMRGSWNNGWLSIDHEKSKAHHGVEHYVVIFVFVVGCELGERLGERNESFERSSLL